VQKLVRLGPVLRGQCRTIQRKDEGLEILDTIELTVSSWRTSGGSQRWLSLSLNSGEHEGLELFVPLEALLKQGELLEGVARGALIE